jgi:hypothetical protein
LIKSNIEDINNEKELKEHHEALPLPAINYNYPYCRNFNTKALIEFKDQYDIVRMVIKDYDRFINYHNKPFIKCDTVELENKSILYDYIATTTSKQLLKEQKENYELRLK